MINGKRRTKRDNKRTLLTLSLSLLTLSLLPHHLSPSSPFLSFLSIYFLAHPFVSSSLPLAYLSAPTSLQDLIFAPLMILPRDYLLALSSRSYFFALRSSPSPPCLFILLDVLAQMCSSHLLVTTSRKSIFRKVFETHCFCKKWSNVESKKLNC